MVQARLILHHCHNERRIDRQPQEFRDDNKLWKQSCIAQGAQPISRRVFRLDADRNRLSRACRVSGRLHGLQVVLRSRPGANPCRSARRRAHRRRRSIPVQPTGRSRHSNGPAAGRNQRPKPKITRQNDLLSDVSAKGMLKSGHPFFIGRTFRRFSMCSIDM